MPASAIGRMEVLRDGASAQYGSEAIAGVLNLVIKEGEFSPFVNADFGRYMLNDFPDDGETFNVNGGWGLKLGRGSLGLFAEYGIASRRIARGPRPPTRSWRATPTRSTPTATSSRRTTPSASRTTIWVTGSRMTLLSFANLRLPINAAGTSELYGFGGYTHRIGTGNGFYRQGLSDRNWPTIYPQGFLPEFKPTVVDWSAAGGVRGVAGGWNYDGSVSYGHNLFDYQLRNTLNASLGPCLDVPCAPGLDGILGNADDPGIPNSTHFFAGGLRAGELGLNVTLAKPIQIGLPNALNVAVGAAFRDETFTLVPGETGSWIQGGHVNQYGDPAPPGSQVFSGFLPTTAADESRTNTGAYVDLETDLTKQLLVNAAARFEDYSDFGSKVSTKLALRFQPATQLVLRGAFSTGFRAPSLAQSFYGSRITNFRLDPVTGKQAPFEVGIFPVQSDVAVTLGAKPLKAETSINYSAGFAWSPTDQFNLTVDGYLIDLNDRILLTSSIGGDSVEAILASKGLFLTSAQYFTNIIDTRTKGVDLTAYYRTIIGSTSALTLSTGMNFTTNAHRRPASVAAGARGNRRGARGQVRDDPDREGAPGLARHVDGGLLARPEQRADPDIVLRQVPLGPRALRHVRPGVRREDAGGRRGRPPVQRRALVAGRA